MSSLKNEFAAKELSGLVTVQIALTQIVLRTNTDALKPYNVDLAPAALLEVELAKHSDAKPVENLTATTFL